MSHLQIAKISGFLLVLIVLLGQNCGKFKPPADLGQFQSGNSPSPLPSLPINPVVDDSLPASPLVPPIAHLETLRTLLETYGRPTCNETQIRTALNPSNVQEGNVWYYDGTWNFHNIARYTTDNSWYTCSDYVARAYRDWVNGLTLVPGDYRPLGGWRLFPHGLQRHFQRTQEPQDRNAIIRLATKSAFLSNWEGVTVGSAPHCSASREVAYLINSFLVGKDFDQDPGPKLNQVIQWALGHLDQWFVAKTCLSQTVERDEMQPFMVGLTTEALLFAYEKIPDPDLRAQIVAKVELSMDELWQIAWREDKQAMISNTVHEHDWGTWPVVNIVIGATYAWLWQINGADRHRERADKLWNGTFTMDFPNQIWGGKQFSQIYRRAFDFLKWRTQPPRTYQPPTRY